MKLNCKIFRTLTLAVALLAGQVAQAETKTVTYTLSQSSLIQGSKLELAISGDTPFDGTTTIESKSSINESATTFTLADGFSFFFRWWGSLEINSKGFFHTGSSANNLEFKVTWDFIGNNGNTHYYVTNVKLTDADGNPMLLDGGGTATTDYNYSLQLKTNKTYNAKKGDGNTSTTGIFKKLTITYTDTPDIAYFNELNGGYKIQSWEDLRTLADYVNVGGKTAQGLTFYQAGNIEQPSAKDYIPIGNDENHIFQGTYDGQGNSISGISLSPPGPDNDNYLGIFGSISNGIVRNVVLTNSSFSGRSFIGGIAGFNTSSTVQNCRVESSVEIYAAKTFSMCHGGIVGSNQGSIIGCLSAATLSGNNLDLTQGYGGIVGMNVDGGIVQDCLYTGSTLDAQASVGAIVGSGNYHTINNYYTDANAGFGGLGILYSTASEDGGGARCARRVTLGENIKLVGNDSPTATYNVSGITTIGSGSYAIRYNNTIFSGATQNLTFAYTGDVPSGYSVDFHVTSGDLYDNVVTMPDADITVTASLAPDATQPQDYINYWQAGDDHKGTQGKPYLITTPEGLNLLSREVNSGHEFDGVYFRLGGNIDMSSVTSFVPVGTAAHPFRGFFLGNDKVISNLTVNKPDDSHVGLFGYCSGATITHVILDCATITGHAHVGALIGSCSSCNFNNNYYRNTIVYGPAGSDYHSGGDSFNIGTGTGDVNGISCDATILVLPASNATLRAALIAAFGDPSSHTAHGGSAPDLSVLTVYSGSTRLYTVTCNEGVSDATPDVALGSRHYYAPGSTVTLTCTNEIPENNTVYFSYTDDSDHDISGNSFTMPESDVTISFRIMFPPQTIALKEGYNWVSFNVDLGINTILEALQATFADKEQEIYFCNLSDYLTYKPHELTGFGSHWHGDKAKAWDFDKKMYQIKVPADGEISLTGIELHPSGQTLYNGLNSLAFPLLKAISIGEAFSGFAVQGDIISSQTASAVYTGSAWRGSLTTLEPGQGYLYLSTAQAEKRHNYPSQSSQAVVNSSNSAPYETHWPGFNFHDKQFQQPVIATVQIGGSPVTSTGNWEALEVAAFVGNECRGHAFMRYDATEFGTGDPVVELPVYYADAISNESGGEPVTFKLYDHVNNQVYDLCFPVTNTAILTGTGYVDVYSGGGNPVSLNFSPDWNGTGSSKDPYIIYSSEGWNVFCDLLKDNGMDYFRSKNVKLATDITASRIAGKETETPFIGSFDGDGHTLTFNYTATGEDFVAPFYCLSNAYNVIQNLHIKGVIRTDAQYAAGIAAKVVYSDVEHDQIDARISNCTSSIVIISSYAGDGHHGGMVGLVDVPHTFSIITGVFDGKLLTTGGTTGCGGLVGQKSGNGKLLLGGTNLYAPAALEDGETWAGKANSATFAVANADNLSIIWAFYTTDFNDGTHYTGQGQQVYSITLADGIYTSSVATTHNGIKYNRPNATITLQPDDGYTLIGSYSVKDADGKDIPLKDGNQFVMPASNVTVTATMEGGQKSITGHLNNGFYWTTYYHGVLRYTLPEGTTAYTMGSDYRLYRLGDDGRTIPAGVAVVIISDKETFLLDKTDDTSTHITDHAPNDGNILLGSDSDVPVASLPEGKSAYVLSIDANGTRASGNHHCCSRSYRHQQPSHHR